MAIIEDGAVLRAFADPADFFEPGVRQIAVFHVAERLPALLQTGGVIQDVREQMPGRGGLQLQGWEIHADDMPAPEGETRRNRLYVHDTSLGGRLSVCEERVDSAGNRTIDQLPITFDQVSEWDVLADDGVRLPPDHPANFYSTQGLIERISTMAVARRRMPLTLGMLGLIVECYEGSRGEVAQLGTN